jgi:polyisoprenoid-binding protein YceI
MLKQHPAIFTVLLFTTCLTLGQSQIKLPIDASHSVISFSVGFAGGITSIDGRFNHFSGEIGYRDPDDRATLFTRVTIDVASLNTGDSIRDKDLMGESYFNVSAYPEITFVSQQVTKEKEGFVLTGILSMLGVSKTLKIPFSFTHQPSIVWVFGEPRLATKATVTLDRTEFGIPKQGWNNLVPSLGSMVLSKDVEVTLKIQGVGPGISQLMLTAIHEEGVYVAIDRYKKLEEENKGKQTYAFGANSILGIVLHLVQNNLIQESIDMAQFNVSHYPDNFIAYYSLAIAYKSQDTNRAIEALEKAIQLKPDFKQANDLLLKLKEK